MQNVMKSMHRPEKHTNVTKTLLTVLLNAFSHVQRRLTVILTEWEQLTRLTILTTMNVKVDTADTSAALVMQNAKLQ